MILSVQDLQFSYYGHHVLKDINIQVQAGELVAILGPNGVGKTTLLKCFNGIHRGQAGTVMVENRDILTMQTREVALKVGYVAQQSENARLTVFDAVLMGRKPHLQWGVGAKDLARVNATLIHMQLDTLALRYIDELSGGELQKVAIARALVQEPTLLLFDEPTSALDLKNQVTTLSIIRKIVNTHKVGAVMTMHDVNSAMRYADRYCFVKEGRIFAIADRDQVTSAMIEEVYGLPVSIHHIDNCPVILPATEIKTSQL